MAYHGARYYAPWLGRWMSCDPKGMVDGVNLYAYVRGNPLRLIDPSGTDSEGAEGSAGVDPHKTVPQTSATTKEAEALSLDKKLAIGFDEAVKQVGARIGGALDFIGEPVREMVEAGVAISNRYQVYAASPMETGPSAFLRAANDVLNPIAHAKQASDRAERMAATGNEEDEIRERVKEAASLADAAAILKGGARKPPLKEPFAIMAGPFEYRGRHIAILEENATGARQMWYQSAGHNAVAGTWYPVYGIADNGWIVKSSTSPFLMREYAAALREAPFNARKAELARVMDEALRSGGKKHEAGFQWLNESPKVIGPAQTMTGAEINAVARQLGAPLRLNQ